MAEFRATKTTDDLLPKLQRLKEQRVSAAYDLASNIGDELANLGQLATLHVSIAAMEEVIKSGAPNPAIEAEKRLDKW